MMENFLANTPLPLAYKKIKGKCLIAELTFTNVITG